MTCCFTVIFIFSLSLLFLSVSDEINKVFDPIADARVFIHTSPGKERSDVLSL